MYLTFFSWEVYMNDDDKFARNLGFMFGAIAGVIVAHFIIFPMLLGRTLPEVLQLL